MEWLFSREFVIVLAVMGGIASGLASLLKARNLATEQRTSQLNVIAYVFMGASMLLFIIAGLRSTAP